MPQQILPTLRTLVLVGMGGVLAVLIDAPSPWLVGPMVAAAIVAVAGGSLTLPNPLQFVASIVVGISMGSGVNPTIVA